MSDIKVFAEEQVDEKLIEMLNVALSSEWIAYIQYSIGASLVRGVASHEIITKMLEHANDEKDHATILINRILELGGKPITNIEKLVNNKYAPYTEPNGDSINILNQNLNSEYVAVKIYTEIAKYIKEKDSVTYNLISEILQDEKDHIEDFVNTLDKME